MCWLLLRLRDIEVTSLRRSLASCGALSTIVFCTRCGLIKKLLVHAWSPCALNAARFAS